MKGEEFVVELVAGVEFEELVGGDDEGVCGGVFRDLDNFHISFLCLGLCVSERRGLITM